MPVLVELIQAGAVFEGSHADLDCPGEVASVVDCRSAVIGLDGAAAVEIAMARE